MVNKCTFIGNVTAKPIIATTKDGGVKYARFSIACNERGYKKADGTEVPERVEFIPLTVWGDKRVELCEKYIDKGQQLYVEGKFQTVQYEKDGEQRRYTDIRVSEIEMIGRRREQAPEPIPPTGTAPAQTTAAATAAAPTTAAPTPDPVLPLDDDLPF